MKRLPSTKRQAAVLSSDSDDYDISKIKKKYNVDNDANKEKTSRSTKGKKNALPANQMTLESSFSKAKPVKRAPENSLEQYFKKTDKKVKKEEIAPSDFFSVSKKEKINKDVNDNQVKKSTPEKPKPIDEDKKKFVIEKSTIRSPEVVETVPKLNSFTTPLKSAEAPEKLVSPSQSGSKKAYHSFMNRSGPSAPGSKPLPEGAPNCLTGMTFVLTGVLDSLEREEAQDLIIKHGGRVTKALSGKTTYLVVGAEAGNSKIDKAVQLKTKQINEDELFNLIATSKPSQPATPSQTKSSKSSAKLNKINEENDLDSKPTQKHSGIDRKINNNDNPLKTVGVKPESALSGQPIMGAKPSIIGTGQSLKPGTSASTQIVKSPNSGSMLLVDKYRPTSSKQLIGQHGDRSPANKLRAWLENWHANRAAGFQKRADQDGAHFRAALLSGGPGIGKTSTALVVARELGFEVRECNASSSRSKRELETVLALDSESNAQCWKPSLRYCLLMDEVDGMAGNEDRGGITTLIAAIRKARIPIVCVCNDRQSPKIRSLANYVYDLRFRTLTVEQVRAAVKSVAFKERIGIPDDRALTEIVLASNCDLRQVLNTVQLMAVQTGSLGSSAEHPTVIKKETVKGPFEVVRRVFSHDGVKTYSEKLDLFFEDIDLSGLFVQENYLSVIPNRSRGDMTKTLKLMSLAADSIADSDVVSKSLRSRNEWGLLPLMGMFSSVFPGEYLHGRLSAQIAFPSWLGKFSSQNKTARTLSRLCLHLRMSTKGGISSAVVLAMDYGPMLADRVLRPLREGDIDSTLSLMDGLDLLREDIDLLIESTTWPVHGDRMASIPSQIKATLTRACNKAGFQVPYKIQGAEKRAKNGGADLLDVLALDGEQGPADERSEDDDTLDNDAMIVKKKKSSSKKAAASKKPAAPAKAKKEPKTSTKTNKTRK